MGGHLCSAIGDGLGGPLACPWPFLFVAHPWAARVARAFFLPRATPLGLGGSICSATSNGVG
eukprot:6940640-Alexandrium_andersonii.AAC.1